MIRKIGHIAFACWLVIITSGLLINKHFSNGRYYSSALYVNAESCCKVEDEMICSAGTCCAPHKEALTCCTTEDSSPTLSTTIIEEAECCNELSTFIQLVQVFSAEKIGVSIPTTGFFTHTGFNSNTEHLNTFDEQPCYLGNSPPLINNTPIFIRIASFLC